MRKKVTADRDSSFFWSSASEFLNNELSGIRKKSSNTLEGFNRQLRKVTKNKAVFPNDDALKKTLYLTTRDITEKWSMPYRDWGETYGQFVIEFGSRASIA